METVDAIKKRRTIRRFKQTPLDDATLTGLIDAARRAPSAANNQPLRYIAVRSKDIVDAVFEHTAWAGHVKPRRNPELGKTAPAAFIAVTGPETVSPQIYADAGAAIENMLLLAAASGLGACWIGAFDAGKVQEILKPDKGRRILYLVALGIPDEEPVSEDIDTDTPAKYYLDGSDVLHVPKFKVESITKWL
jgi:nitroreductase